MNIVFVNEVGKINEYIWISLENIFNVCLKSIKYDLIKSNAKNDGKKTAHPLTILFIKISMRGHTKYRNCCRNRTHTML